MQEAASRWTAVKPSAAVRPPSSRTGVGLQSQIARIDDTWGVAGSHAMPAGQGLRRLRASMPLTRAGRCGSRCPGPRYSQLRGPAEVDGGLNLGRSDSGPDAQMHTVTDPTVEALTGEP